MQKMLREYPCVNFLSLSLRFKNSLSRFSTTQDEIVYTSTFNFIKKWKKISYFHILMY